MNNYFLLFALAIGLLASCAKEERDTVKTEVVRPGNIDFSNIQVGQKSHYLKYWYDCSNADPTSIYTGDTLIVEIIEKTGTLFMKEYNTAGSISQIDTTSYEVYSSEGQIEIPNRENSNLFFFYDNDIINLNPQNFKFMQQGSCNLMLNGQVFDGDDIGLIEELDIRGMQYQQKLTVSCVPIFELDGYLIYDAKQLMMSHRYWTSSFMGQIDAETVEGYQLIN